MQKLKLALATSLALATLSLGTPAFAGSSHMDVGAQTSQPIGHYQFCKKFIDDCSIKTTATKAPKLTRKRWKEIVEINTVANREILPVTDQEFYGTEEFWTYPKSYGDCEDYVLLKRHLLMQKGWPASSLLITVVRQPNGEGHAVLTVRTDRADYVLDNLHGKIREWRDTEYRYLKRQASYHSGRWVTIFDKRDTVASIAK